jgi:hypothetical protein
MKILEKLFLQEQKMLKKILFLLQRHIKRHNQKQFLIMIN